MVIDQTATSHKPLPRQKGNYEGDYLIYFRHLALKERNVDRLESHRKFFADLLTAAVGVKNARLVEALAATPRERFLGPGPWRIFAGGGYFTTPTDDPAFLYQDVV